MRKCRAARHQRAQPRTALAFGAAVVATVVLLTVVSGCSTTPSTAAQQLDRTVELRDRAAVEAHEASMARVAVFLRNKWGPVPLPESGIDRWVGANEWAPTMARCLAGAGFEGVRSADDGERLDFSGLRAVDPRTLFEIDVAIYDCQDRYPVLSWFEGSVRDIEAPWALEYTRAVLVPCLLAAGHPMVPVPELEQFRANWRTDTQFDPYALVGDSPASIARARAMCPPPEAVLDAPP